MISDARRSLTLNKKCKKKRIVYPRYRRPGVVSSTSLGKYLSLGVMLGVGRGMTMTMTMTTEKEGQEDRGGWG